MGNGENKRKAAFRKRVIPCFNSPFLTTPIAQLLLIIISAIQVQGMGSRMRMKGYAAY